MKIKERYVRRIMFCVMLALLLCSLGMSMSTSRAFAATTSVLPPTGAATHPATATCTGDGCDNLDPIVTNCNDSTAKTVKQVNITGAANTPDAGTLALVEERYSVTCGTNWTRFTTYVGNVNALATIERVLEPNVVYLKYCVPVSCYAANNSAYPSGYPSWTNMVYAPTTPAKACGTVVSMTTGRTYRACVQF